MRRVLTYGTFDLLHWGHIRLLMRAKALGDYLIVGASTDEFAVEQKRARRPYHRFGTRCDMLEAVRYVDLVIEESSWEQKVRDVQRYHVDTVVMGANWQGSPRFEHLREHCELVYLPRTPGISTSKIRRDMLADAAAAPGRFSGLPGVMAAQFDILERSA
ncbi:adenylyltransferase/cytidyltransferase family protein [Nesterenkonia sphaerica]|uniref:Glycerol-3-phosphate cytidylyltransferase n=1 Tax=Nesterenkonia sphaerica TaxID=1804988 RepID=A0A5R9ABZ5_9MICC|nr:glycerol-3-phosphate cytidylyltransferase [Nesterenkonia sphaerica]